MIHESSDFQDGLGSEFKAMIQCPPGMNMVGAEFDVQMWIGSVMGDASFGGLHGSTASGWIALQVNSIATAQLCLNRLVMDSRASDSYCLSLT